MEKDTLADDRDEFSACEEHERDQRKQSLADLEFAKLSQQWDEKDRTRRESSGRPCLTINRIPAFTKQVTNDARINRAQIKVQPVGNGADKLTADIKSDLIRNIETASQADQSYDCAYDFAVTCGFGYFRIAVDYPDDDAFEQEISIVRVSNPFSVYGDYDSTAGTSIDWKRAFVTDWYSKSEFEDRWGTEAKATSFQADSKDYTDQWFEDKGEKIRVAERWIREKKPTRLIKLSNGMVLYEEQLVKIADMLTAQGVTVVGDRDAWTWKVRQRIITGTDVLEENDWAGKYIPIVPMYGEETNVNGKRLFFSLIHRAKDSQRLYNYQRSLAAELGALQPKAPYIGPKGMFNSDADRWSTANVEPHAYLEYDPVPEAPGAMPQRQVFQGPPAGVMQEALMAADDMKAIMGIYDASLGARSNETSGRAIMARQREGDVSTYDFRDNRNRAVEHGGRIILDLLPKVYSKERILRAVQEDGTSYQIPVNQPAVNPQILQAVMAGQQIPQQQDQSGPPQFVPLPPNVPPSPQLQALVRVFDLSAGKYDVTVTAGPSFTSRREEAATQMMEFIRVFPQSAGLIGDLLAKNLDWPGSEQVAERLKAMLPPQARSQVDPMVAQLQGMLQQQDAQAKQAVATLQGQIGELQKQMADRQAEFALKDKELNIRAADAETKRMEVLKPEAPQVTADPVKVEEVRIAAHEAETKRLEAETDRIKVENDRIKAEAELIKAKAEAYQLLCSHEKTAIVVQAGEAEGEQEGAGDAEEGDEGGQQEMPAPMSQADELRMQLLAAINGITAVAEGMNRPKTVIRDDQGRVVGLQ